MEEEQTTQWTKEKGQTDKQRSTNHTHETKDRVNEPPYKPGVNSRKVSSSCVIDDTCSVNLFTIPVISNERRKDREVITTNETYPWSFVTQVFHSRQPGLGDDRETFEVITST